jgi:hypothetical protein
MGRHRPCHGLFGFGQEASAGSAREARRNTAVRRWHRPYYGLLGVGCWSVGVLAVVGTDHTMVCFVSGEGSALGRQRPYYSLLGRWLLLVVAAAVVNTTRHHQYQCGGCTFNFSICPLRRPHVPPQRAPRHVAREGRSPAEATAARPPPRPPRPGGPGARAPRRAGPPAARPPGARARLEPGGTRRTPARQW